MIYLAIILLLWTVLVELAMRTKNKSYKLSVFNKSVRLICLAYIAYYYFGW